MKESESFEKEYVAKLFISFTKKSGIDSQGKRLHVCTKKMNKGYSKVKT